MLFIAFLILLIWTIISFKSRLNTIMFSIWTIVFFLFSLIYILANYFTWNWFDASVMYHLQYWQEWAWISSSIEIILIGFLALIIWITYTLWTIKILKNKKYRRKQNNKVKTISFLLLFLSFIIHPLTNNILNLNWFYFKKDTVKYDIDFEKNYIISENIKNDINTKNLVFIYLESFENLYLNNDIFPNLTPNLNSLKKESTYFSNIDMSYMSYWTISWMVWSQCWLPIKAKGWEENATWFLKNWFMSKAYCMWDFLKKDWYNLNYIWGADINFAWKWDFYKTHWFDEVKWRDEILKDVNLKSYIHDWWLYDDTLFEEAYKKYENLSNKNEKFALFMLTLDTHWDSWTISKSCWNLKYNNNKKSVLNSYHCSDKLVWDFVRKIQSSPNYKDTLIVLVSDHYAMEMNNSIKILHKNEDKRKLTFMILDSENKNFTQIDKLWQTFDIWSTVLYKMWYNIEWLWLWRNLFQHKSLNELYKNMDYSIWDDIFEKFFKG